MALVLAGFGMIAEFEHFNLAEVEKVSSRVLPGTLAGL